MRSLRGRDEIDPMTSNVDLQKPNQQLSFNQAWLEHCLSIELVDLHCDDEGSEINKFWVEINRSLQSDLADLSLQNPDCFAISARAFKKAKKAVKKFKLKNQILLSSDQIEDIELSLNHLEFNKKKSNSLNILFKELSKSIDSKDRCNSYLRYLDNILDIALPFLEGRRFDIHFIASTIQYFDYLLNNIYMLVSDEKLDLNIIKQINIKSNKLFVFVKHLRNVVKDKYPDFPDDLIQIKNDENEIIYIDPKSAEGKAITRIQEAKGDTSDWETTIQPGDEIDLDETFNWLEANGFA